MGKTDLELMKEDWRLLIESYNDKSFLKQVNDNAKELNKKIGHKVYACLACPTERN